MPARIAALLLACCPLVAEAQESCSGSAPCARWVREPHRSFQALDLLRLAGGLGVGF